MRITIEQELKTPDYSPVKAEQLLHDHNGGALNAMADKIVNDYAESNNVKAMSPTEVKIVLRNMPTPIGFSAPTYLLSVTTDVFAHE